MNDVVTAASVGCRCRSPSTRMLILTGFSCSDATWYIVSYISYMVPTIWHAWGGVEYL